MRMIAELEDEEIGVEKSIEENIMMGRHEKETVPYIDNYNDYLFYIDNVRQ